MAIALRTTVASAQGASAGASLVLTIPASVAVNDLMYVVVSSGTAGNTVTISGTGTTGFTARSALTYNTVSNPCGGAVYYRFATAGDTGGAATYTWTLSSSTAHWSVSMAVWSGVDAVTTYDATIQRTLASAGTSAGVPHPSITPVAATDMLLLPCAHRFTTSGTTPTFTAPTGTAFAVTDNTTSGVAQNGGTSIAYLQLASSAVQSGYSTGTAILSSYVSYADLLLPSAVGAAVVPQRARVGVGAYRRLQEEWRRRPSGILVPDMSWRM